MDLSVLKRDGSSTGETIELAPTVFDIDPNDHAIWLDVRAIQANGRQGTHEAKKRGEVRGGGRKPWRQKGTGRARHGTIRSPLWVGGGVVFAPKPRDYSVKLTRKTKKLARRSAFTYKAREEAIRIVEDFTMDVPKTRDFASMLNLFDLSEEKVLFLTGERQMNIYKSGRNIPRVTVKEAADVSTFDILDADVVIFQRSGLEKVTDQLRTAPAETA
jgi:large subunit ribosomal protein L4